MVLSSLDQALVYAYFAASLVVGAWVARRAGRSSSEFFLSGRAMPWWLLGMSTVATTFSTPISILPVLILQRQAASDGSEKTPDCQNSTIDVTLAGVDCQMYTEWRNKCERR